MWHMRWHMSLHIAPRRVTTRSSPSMIGRLKKLHTLLKIGAERCRGHDNVGRRTQKPCTRVCVSRDAGGRAPASRDTQKLQYKRLETQSESIFYLTVLRFCVSLRLPPSLPKCLGYSLFNTFSVPNRPRLLNQSLTF
jgi:hypothetical protein